MERYILEIRMEDKIKITAIKEKSETKDVVYIIKKIKFKFGASGAKNNRK